MMTMNELKGFYNNFGEATIKDDEIVLEADGNNTYYLFKIDSEGNILGGMEKKMFEASKGPQTVFRLLPDGGAEVCDFWDLSQRLCE